jgi:Tfp pilus assembly protein PilP
MGNIDQILEGDEEVLSGNSFTYDPGNRRDPFKSLLIAPDRPEFRGPRPEGVPGLLIDEIDLKGIFRTARGYVAQVNAANQKKSYLLKEGDQLYDGDVVSIGKSEVVFKQIVQDPTALKPFREVVKSLNPG